MSNKYKQAKLALFFGVVLGTPLVMSRIFSPGVMVGFALFVAVGTIMVILSSDRRS